MPTALGRRQFHTASWHSPDERCCGPGRRCWCTGRVADWGVPACRSRTRSAPGSSPSPAARIAANWPDRPARTRCTDPMSGSARSAHRVVLTSSSTRGHAFDQASGASPRKVIAHHGVHLANSQRPGESAAAAQRGVRASTGWPSWSRIRLFQRAPGQLAELIAAGMQPTPRRATRLTTRPRRSATSRTADRREGRGPLR